MKITMVSSISLASYVDSILVSDHYIQAIALLFANLAPFPDLLRPIVDVHILRAGPSILSSHIMRTCIADAPDLFYTLECVSPIVKKINACIGENPSISRPGREAKDLMKATLPYMDDADVQSLL
jgi:hypothetical protein